MTAITKATITATSLADGKVLLHEEYPLEKDAQDYFDSFTHQGSEHNGDIEWNLTAHHIELGPLCRRTMYTRLKELTPRNILSDEPALTKGYSAEIHYN
jgi:hypothetical protein